jgi:IS5 family transposase
VALRRKHLPKRDLEQINVDTTVQEKNITYPTDSKLLYRCIAKLASAAQGQNIPLRQSYVRVGKRAAIQAGRYAHAKQFRRMNRELRRLRTYLGRLIRDIRRKTKGGDLPTGQAGWKLEPLLRKAERIRTQQRHDTNKLYSLHEPDVQCISKGKAHKRYEFGQKIAIATTNRSHWFVAAELMAGNPYDGHTLKKTLQATEANTGVAVREAYVDKGYRGHDYDGLAKIHLAGTDRRRLTRTQKQKRKRRAAIEPKIGHLKSDARMGRCFLKGLKGDAINAVLAAAGSNLLKLLRLLYFALREWSYFAGQYMLPGRFALASRGSIDPSPSYPAA